MHKGSSIDRLVLPERLSKLLGVKVMLLISSASSINEAYNPGDIMFLKDHINFLGFGNDKVASPDERWGGGKRTLKYNDLRKSAMEAARNSGFPGQVHEGVYICASMGKHQTIMETKMFKQLGGDVVGTSIAYETLAAVECQMEVVALAIITATVPLDYDSEIREWEWLDDTMPPLLGEMVKGLSTAMKEQGMIEEEKPPEPPQEETPEETAPEQTGEEVPPPEGAEEDKPPEETELPTEQVEEEVKPSEEGKPPGEEEKKPKKPCECKKKPSEAAPPPPPEQPPEEKKKKRSCECKDKKKAEGGAPSASKVPSAAGTPAGAASPGKVPSGAGTPGGAASAGKVPSGAATPAGAGSVPQVASEAATPGGGASAGQVASAAATPVENVSAAEVPSANPEEAEQ